MVRFSCSKSEAIKALWENGTAIGLGRLHSHVSPTDEEIATVVAKGYADYLNGKPMKINLNNWPEIHPGGYDRDNGLGAMQRVSDSVSRGDAADLARGETKELNASERAQVIREANASLQVTSSISAPEGDADARAASSCEPAGDTSAAGPRAPPHPAQGACGRSSAGAF